MSNTSTSLWHCAATLALCVLLFSTNLCSACRSQSYSSCRLSVTQAVVTVLPYGSGSSVSGTLTLRQDGSQLRIIGQITGLKPNQLHGFHIHESGNVGGGCGGARGHYNPNNLLHAGPLDSGRHVGDLGNIRADSKGVSTINIVDSVAALNTAQSVIGRAFVVHAGEDDLGRGGNAESKLTGNAGPRLACGVIAVL